MHEYGNTNWEDLWEKLEQSGNVGIDYVINPSLYKHIVNYLALHPKSVVADYGCGTNLMGIQILFGYKDSIPALKDVSKLGEARFNTLLYIGIEGSQELVDQSNKYLEDIGSPKNIGTIQAHIDSKLNLFNENTLDLCVSRNFLMHLSAEELDAHFAYVAHTLKEGAACIFTTLNPEYELKKVGRDMENGEKYDFLHGKSGEHGTFYHYYKTPGYWQGTIEKYFIIELKEACVPITDRFRESHARYYDDTPMAYTYVLKKKTV